jgi:molybdopterin converting factor subunit 1
MTLNVLFFAQAREYAGCSSAALDVPEGSSVLDALDVVVARYPAMAALRGHVALALNGVLARGGEPLVDGAELALLPPVSGG